MMALPFVSLARRFAYTAALLAGIAMLGIAGASLWLINQEHAASFRSLLKKDAELQATTVSSNLREIAGRMSDLANSSLIANTLLDSDGRDRYLIPFLNSSQRIHDIPVAILLADFEGREIARNSDSGFSQSELNWLAEKLAIGQPASRVQLGEEGEELIAVEFIVLSRSNSVEGALLYKIKLDKLSLRDGVRLVRGKESEQLLQSQVAVTAAVNLPLIYKDFNFAVLISSDPDARPVNWQPLGVFLTLAIAMVAMVMILGLQLGKRLTRDLRALELFAQRVAKKGLGVGRAEAADSLEVASLAQSINSMLDRLKQQHDSLYASEERFRSIFKYSKVGMSVQAIDGRCLEVNPAFVAMTGYSEEELLRTNLRDITHPDDVVAGTARGDPLRAGEVDYFQLEKRYIHKDGRTLWADLTVSAVQDDAGKLVCVIGISQDITERKGAREQILLLNESLEALVQRRTAQLQSQQEELRQSRDQIQDSEAILSATISTALDAVVQMDAAGIVTRWNIQAEKIFGWKREEAIGLKLYEMIIPLQYREAHVRGIKHFLATGEGPVLNKRIEISALHRAGHEFPIELAITPIKIAGQFEFSAFIRDITERRQIQEALRRSNQELEAFSYSVSHDLRTPLSSIDGFSKLLSKGLGADAANERSRHYVSRIRAGVVQMGELIDALLSLAQVSRSSLRWDDVDLTDMAHSIVNGYQEREPGRNVLLDIQPGLLAQGDARLLKQVLDNLLGNAWKFSGKQPQSRITFRRESSPDGKEVYVVQDNGAGFDMAHVDKLFGAFQRLHTAAEFAGTGIGLATAHKIVTRHGGRIWAESSPGRGGTFYFTLGSALA